MHIMKNAETQSSFKNRPIEKHSFFCVFFNDATSCGFTLIELLIVIGLLGALACLILPRFQVTKTDACEQLAISEMGEIQHAFVRFYNDCMPTNTLSDWSDIGLAPLIERTGANYTFDEYDPARNRGWRGPYAAKEGDADGAPVLFDPYGDPDHKPAPYEIWQDGTNLFIRLSTNSVSVETADELKRQVTFNAE